MVGGVKIRPRRLPEPARVDMIAQTLREVIAKDPVVEAVQLESVEQVFGGLPVIRAVSRDQNQALPGECSLQLLQLLELLHTGGTIRRPEDEQERFARSLGEDLLHAVRQERLQLSRGQRGKQQTEGNEPGRKSIRHAGSLGSSAQPGSSGSLRQGCARRGRSFGHWQSAEDDRSRSLSAPLPRALTSVARCPSKH